MSNTGVEDTILSAVFALKEQMGELHADVVEIKTDGKNTLKQVEKTNGRVTRIEQQIIPDIKTELSKKTTYDDCKNHKKSLVKHRGDLQNEINQVKDRTNVVTWLFEKPLRFVAAISLPAIITEFTTDAHWTALFDWVIKIF